MAYLNHITLSTGDLRRSPRHEVTDSTLRYLVPWLDSAIAAGTLSPLPIPALAHFSVRATVEGGALVATLLAPLGPHTRGKPYSGETLPLVTVGVSQRSRQGAELWAMLVGQFGAVPGLKMPDEPWCAVALHPGVIGYPDDIGWLGDFERCIAWAWMTRNPDLQLMK